MKFSWTGEVSARVDRQYVRVCEYLERSFNRELNASSLSTSSVEINFCPVLMDAELRQYYPARSKISKSEGVYYCCPQLDFDVFLHGSFEAQVENCLAELKASGEYLRRLGMNSEELLELQGILSRMRP